MLRPQKKVSKREIKEDQLVSRYFQIRKWVEDNKRLATYIVGTPVVAVAALLLWNAKQNDANNEASTRLARILPYYTDGRYEQAVSGIVQEGIQGLQQIVDNYGSTPSGEYAKLYLANCYLAEGKYDRARGYFKDVDVSDKLLGASALAGVATCAEAMGNREEAAMYFEKAALNDMTELSAPEYLVDAAENYSAVGNKAKAGELLETLKKEFPSSSYARDFNRYRAQYAPST
ncbi:MAG TPA: tetratricopeptide repeat protein [Bacteroidota bacterium]|nr:tetratricopeptide repeat protein [Bacteroidota bacterium]